MNEQLEFLKIIAPRLESAGIPYMMTGSMAMALYSMPRMTRDIDIIIDPTPEDADVLYHLFQGDCYIDYESVIEAISNRGMFNIIHNEWIIKADFIVRKDEIYRKVEFERRRKVEIQGMNIFTVSPEDLVLSKLYWSSISGSELQKRDARSIVQTAEGLDWAYLERWAKILNLDRLLGSIRRDE